MSYENTSLLNIPLKDNATIIKEVKKMFSIYTPRGAKNQSVVLKSPPTRW